MTPESNVDTTARQRLSKHATYRDATLLCDVVMKGGITSGIVYPLAICELASVFHLKNVGGTSAGAIAAAAAAAAQYGRMSASEGPHIGFPGLAQLQEELAADNGLMQLFTPNRCTARIHGVAMALLRRCEGPGKYVRRLAAVLWQLLRMAFSSRQFWLPVVGMIPGSFLLWLCEWTPGRNWAIGFGLLASTGWLAMGVAEVRRNSKWFGLVSISLGFAGLLLLNLLATQAWSTAWGLAAAWLLLVVGGTSGLLLAAWLSTTRALTTNAYGLTTGYTQHNGGGTSLTQWLTDRLDGLAGLDSQKGPLTFGHLWRGPQETGSPEHPETNLEMLTTNLTQGCPYRMPGDFGRRFYFNPKELARFFPARVIEHMQQHAASSGVAPIHVTATDTVLQPLPAPQELPVVVATRMSLSFPGLISSVPLYAFDHSNFTDAKGQPTDRKHAVPTVCWFSDGGITSNFPVSFFDRRLPRWPTFGINLRTFHPRRPQRANEADNIYVPRTNNQGITEWWTTWDRTQPSSMRQFLSTIFDTMQNWVDNQQIRIPGFRDRIAHIHHSEEEGGLNLDMQPHVIAALSERGRVAGARLARYYSTEPETDDTTINHSLHHEDDDERHRVVSWRNHRWVRLRSTLGLLQEELLQILAAYHDDKAPYQDDLQESLTNSPSYQWVNAAQRDLAISLMEGSPLADAAQKTAGLIDLAERLKEAIAQLGNAADGSGLRQGTPSPEPELRVMPRHSRRTGH